MRFYVGNLNYVTEEQTLRDLFSECGTVGKIDLIADFETGMSRGFGFVDLETDDGQAAIDILNGREIDGRPLVINEARKKVSRDRNNTDGRY